MSARLKQLALGTPIGRAAMWARDTAGLIRTALTKPEQLPAELNDRLATHLVTHWPCNVFLDVGAHIGSIIAAVRHNNLRACVIAVEAMPEKAAALRLKFPGLRAVHACAVGESTGEVAFFVRPKASGYSSLVRAADSVQITVPLRMLDDLVHEPVGVIKIDVEGAELGVLRGAQRLVTESRPVIMFESGPCEAMYSKADMWAWLTARDYEILTPDRMAHNGPGLGREGFEEAHWYPRRTTDYFAVPAERRDEVRETARRLLGVKS